LYRERFRPSQQLDRPYVIAGVNVVVADTTAQADAHLQYAQRRRIARFLARRDQVTDEQADALLNSPAGQQVLRMMEYTAAGDPPAVRQYLDSFARHADADELIVTLMSPGLDNRLRAAGLLAEAAELPAA
jgi:alkanesulfonate monooxygenase SsuD/methylene tetrahydromethanopterin reductase-like flavin-dependent oxidoreductase (luciferase family)